MSICPYCKKDALNKSLYSDNLYCFPRRGGCGKQVPNLEIVEEGLDCGFAIQPYSLNSINRSELGDLVNKLKYWDIDVNKKLAEIDKIMPIIEESFRRISDKFHPRLEDDEILFIPVPSSKNRNLQHVYEITRQLSEGLGTYIEAIKKLSDAEAKTMDESTEYKDGSFSIMKDIDLKGKTVVIIDDTYGKGKTSRAIIKLLRCADVKNIYFMSLCKNTNGGIKNVK